MLEYRWINFEGRKLLVIGECHIYSKGESNKADALLKKNRFDIVFAEGVELGNLMNRLLSLIYKLVARGSGRGHPTFLKLAEKNKIKIKSLEDTYKPPRHTKYGVVCFLLILLAVLALMVVNIRTLIELPIVIKLFILLLAGLFGDRLISYLTDKENRDKQMTNRLWEYISKEKFESAAVVIGREHFSQMIELFKYHRT